MTERLNPAQLAALQARLRERYTALREEVRHELLQSEDEQYIDIAGRVHDAGDESVADLLADRNIIIVEHLVTELRALEDALLRIDSGSYGRCQDCDAVIAYPRLEAQPEATRCLNCQAKAEASEKQPPSL